MASLRSPLSQPPSSFATTCKRLFWGAHGAATLQGDNNTHIQLKGLQHCPVPAGDGGEKAKHLLDDAVQVVEAVDVVEPEGALADAAIVEDALAAQLLPQLLQNPGVLEELHDQRGAGTGGGGVGSKDELQGSILKDKSKAGVRHGGWIDRQASSLAQQGTGVQAAMGYFFPQQLSSLVMSDCKVSPCAGTRLGHPSRGASRRALGDAEDQRGRRKSPEDGS